VSEHHLITPFVVSYWLHLWPSICLVSEQRYFYFSSFSPLLQESLYFSPKYIDTTLVLPTWWYAEWRNCCVGSRVVTSLISFTCSMTPCVPLDVCRDSRIGYIIRPGVSSLRHVMDLWASVLTRLICSSYALRCLLCWGSVTCDETIRSQANFCLVISKTINIKTTNDCVSPIIYGCEERSHSCLEERT
jgi:hypothetical protein